jgi:26S proteasome regulatory subunit N1
LPEPEDGIVLSTAHKIFMKVNKLCDAMRVALKIGVQSTIEETFLASKDPLEKKQLCYILARHGHPLKLDEGPCEQEGDDAEELTLIMSNSKLCENYLTLARDLDVMEAKLPEDIYKTHLIEGRAPSGPAVDSARANLAATFVNAFVNAGFGHDKLLTAQSAEGTTGEGGSSSNVSWIFKNKDRSCEFRICVAVGRRRWFTASGYVFVFRRAVSRCWWSPRRRFDQHEREKRLRSSLRSALRIRQQR